MIWVGVTGGIGCGKSTVVSFFQKLGFGLVSADNIVHELYESPGVQEKVCSLLNLDGEFSKDAVAKAVFGKKEKLKDLESFIHPLVREKTEEKRKKLTETGVEISFYEIPLLFEKNMQDRFDCTICVGADQKIQIERIKNRNSWSDEEIANRMAAQLPLVEKKERADFYIDNSGGLENLESQCRLTADKIKERFKAKN